MRSDGERLNVNLNHSVQHIFTIYFSICSGGIMCTLLLDLQYKMLKRQPAFLCVWIDYVNWLLSRAYSHSLTLSFLLHTGRIAAHRKKNITLNNNSRSSGSSQVKYLYSDGAQPNETALFVPHATLTIPQKSLALTWAPNETTPRKHRSSLITVSVETIVWSQSVACAPTSIYSV